MRARRSSRVMSMPATCATTGPWLFGSQAARKIPPKIKKTLRKAERFMGGTISNLEKREREKRVEDADNNGDGLNGRDIRYGRDDPYRGDRHERELPLFWSSLSFRSSPLSR